MNKKWCVYVHISPSKKYYVGITSQKPNDRWRNGNGYKSHVYFWRAIQKYGWNNFQHEIVAGNLMESEAKNFEKILIEKLQSNNPKYGYNVTAGGDGTVGVQHFGSDNPFYGKHHSDEVKEVLRKTRELYKDDIKELLGRPVYQFDLNGNFVHKYSTIREAEEQTGISHSVISRVCQGKLNHTHGYTWVYQDECDNFDKFKENFLLKLQRKQNNYGKHLRKPVNLYDLTGNFIAYFESTAELAKQFGVDNTTVQYACRHDSVFQRKYKCKYV